MRTFIAFWFGLLAETLARISLVIQPDMDVDFSYLSKNNKGNYYD